MKHLFRPAIIIIAISVGLGGCDIMAERILTAGPNGSETPASVGIAYERASIRSGPRHLDGYLVMAPARCADAPVLVVYHGVQETISQWVHAQRLLYDRCVSSLVFDYTGSGNSSRPATIEAVNEDGVSAYEFALSRFPRARIYVFGHSMGNSIMLEAIPRFSKPPVGVIIANAFSSLRDSARRSSMIYSFLSYFMPDWWDNVEAVAGVQVPLLVLCSDADQVNPTEDGRKIFAAASEPKKFALLHGFTHNALYKQPNEAWWGVVLDFIGASPEQGAKAPPT